MTAASQRWGRFLVVAPGERPARMRSIVSPEGIADRLRSAAMAEIQARDAFLDAAERFEHEAPSTVWVRRTQRE